MRHIQAMSRMIPHLAAIGCAAVMACGGAAVATPGPPPGDRGPEAGNEARARPDRPGNGGGNGRNPGRNPGNGGGRNPIVPPQAAPPQPVLPPNPIAPSRPSRDPAAGRSPRDDRPSTSPGDRGAGTSGAGAAPATAGTSGAGTGSGSTAPATTPTTAVPSGVRTRGLAAGRGPITIKAYVDLGDPDDAYAHLAISPDLLDAVASDGTARVLLCPLVTRRDVNSTEAARVLLAASRQNRAWQVAAGLARTRLTRDGDWLTAATLRRVVRSAKRVSAKRLTRDAKARRTVRNLNRVRKAARKDRVRKTPAFVVEGPGGERRVTNPTGLGEIMGAVDAVR